MASERPPRAPARPWQRQQRAASCTAPICTQLQPRLCNILCRTVTKIIEQGSQQHQKVVQRERVAGAELALQGLRLLTDLRIIIL